MNTATNAVNASAAAQTLAIRMFANFDKQYFVPLTGELENKDKLFDKLKMDGVGLSRHSMELLLAGSEPVIRGYEVVDVPNKHVIPQAAKRPEGVVDRVFMSQGYKPAGDQKAVRPGSVIAKGIEALKDGVTLEQLSKILDHASIDATRAFMSRPKKRGYGIRFDAETNEYFLIMPTGVKEILYKGAPVKPGEKEED